MLYLYISNNYLYIGNIMPYFNLVLKGQISEFEDYTLINEPIGRIDLDLSLNSRIFLIKNPKSKQILINFKNLNFEDNFFKEWAIYIQNINNDITDIKLIFEDTSIKWDYLPNPLISINSNSLLGYYFCKDLSNNIIDGVFIGEYLIKSEHHKILKPNILTPNNDESIDKSNIHITSSKFKTQILEDKHLYTDYKITSDNLGSEIIYSVDKSLDLTDLTLNLTDILISDNKYYVFVRYYGELTLNPSEWSDPISFTIT